MFRRSSEPLPLSEASLLALRPALNAPVLNVKFLPVGPAKAAIVVFAEEYGGIGLAIGVRSNEGGQVVVFRNQEAIDANVPIADALESALGTAEQLGFLFDEDMVESVPGGQGRSQAMELWGRLMGELEMPSSPETAAAQAAASEPTVDSDSGSTFNTAIGPEVVPELILEDEAGLDAPEISLELDSQVDLEVDVEDVELDLNLDELSIEEDTEWSEEVVSGVPEATPPSTPSPPAAAATPPEQQLSKFRSLPPETKATEKAEETSDGATNGGSALGRVPIVRIRRDGSKRVPYIARLLSSF